MKRTDAGKINSEINQSADNALRLLKEGQLSDAQSEFSFILRTRYNSTIAEFGLKVTRYWLQRLKDAQSTPEGCDRGVYLFDQWTKFEDFCRMQHRVDDNVVTAIRYYVFNFALEQFNKDASSSKRIGPKLLYMAALAYKKIADYRNSMTAFERLLSFDIDNADVLAQLADVYVLTGRIPAGKVLFREAFKDNPAEIKLENIESDLFRQLIDAVRKAEPTVDDRTLLYWIPVYGRIYGILNISREMTPGDFMKLKKQITIMEREIGQSSVYDSALTARLLNKYLLLYDIYGTKSGGKEKREEIENNIKKIAYNIYILFKKYEQEIG